MGGASPPTFLKGEIMTPKMKYVHTTTEYSSQPRITIGNIYEIITWYGDGGSMWALIIADDGGLYQARNLDISTEWEIIRI